MEEETGIVLRTLSLLLQYPKEGTASSDLGWERISPSEEKNALENFCSYRRRTPLLTIQEEYTRIFDLDPSMSLNLGCHHREAHSRGKLLLDLQQRYRDAGWENLPGELPDYFPMILEFMSICPETHRAWIGREYGEILAALASRVSQSQSPYAPLMTTASRLFSQFARGKKEE